MRVQPALFSEHAAVITVISMQLIVVFGTGVYDIWDFIISGICFWFGLEVFRIGYADTLGRALIASNMGISATFFIIHAAAFALYFGQQWWFQEDPPAGWFYSLPFTEHVVRIDPSGRYAAEPQVGEIIALVAILPAWFFCPKRARQ